MVARELDKFFVTDFVDSGSEVGCFVIAAVVTGVEDAVGADRAGDDVCHVRGGAFERRAAFGAFHVNSPPSGGGVHG